MTAMPEEYVEQRNGGYYVAGSRVSLDSIVCAFLRGESPEGIVESFPAVSLEAVFGAIAFYLVNRDLIDSYLQQGSAEFAQLREDAMRRNPALYAKLQAAKRESVNPAA
jgi:uncharacterized protein (DUF433 family)